MSPKTGRVPTKTSLGEQRVPEPVPGRWARVEPQQPHRGDLWGGACCRPERGAGFRPCPRGTDVATDCGSEGPSWRSGGRGRGTLVFPRLCKAAGAVCYVAFPPLYLGSFALFYFPSCLAERGVCARSLHVSPNRCGHALRWAGAGPVWSGGGQPATARVAPSRNCRSRVSDFFHSYRSIQGGRGRIGKH